MRNAGLERQKCDPHLAVLPTQGCIGVKKIDPTGVAGEFEELNVLFNKEKEEDKEE